MLCMCVYICMYICMHICVYITHAGIHIYFYKYVQTQRNLCKT